MQTNRIQDVPHIIEEQKQQNNDQDSMQIRASMSEMAGHKHLIHHNLYRSGEPSLTNSLDNYRTSMRNIEMIPEENVTPDVDSRYDNKTLRKNKDMVSPRDASPPTKRTSKLYDTMSTFTQN